MGGYMRGLRSRNIALLIGVALMTQLMTLLLLWALVAKPQVERLGGVMASSVLTVAQSLAQLDPAKRASAISKINREQAIIIVPEEYEARVQLPRLDRFDRIFFDSYSAEMKRNNVPMRQFRGTPQAWALFVFGGRRYLISFSRPMYWYPAGAVAASLLFAIFLSVVAGIAVQRRLSIPLDRLASSANNWRPDRPYAPLPEAGAKEIVDVIKAFNMMADRIARHDTERTFMLAGISHDLRTPLMKGRLALELADNVDAETRSILDRQFNRIDVMLQQFLDFTRGVEAEAKIPLDLEEAVRMAMAESGAENVDLIAPSRVVIDGYPFALQRGLINLLLNASRYGTPPIVVRISQMGRTAEISVCDNGEGIEPALIDQMAKPFVRGDKARSASGGAGLGLAIVRHIAAAHGGRLTLANRASDGGGEDGSEGESRGLCATITLPL